MNAPLYAVVRQPSEGEEFVIGLDFLHPLDDMFPKQFNELINNVDANRFGHISCQYQLGRGEILLLPDNPAVTVSDAEELISQLATQLGLQPQIMVLPLQAANAQVKYMPSKSEPQHIIIRLPPNLTAQAYGYILVSLFGYIRLLEDSSNNIKSTILVCYQRTSYGADVHIDRGQLEQVLEVGQVIRVFA